MLAQLLRFAIVGTAGFGVDTIVLYFGLWVLGLGPYSARLISFLVAATATWFCNRVFTFGDADRNHDGTLNAEELRGYLADAPRDVILDVAFPPEGSGKALAVVRLGDAGTKEGMTVRQLAADVFEVDVGPIRLDIHADDGADAIESVRRGFRARFDSADANQDGYLEMDELSQDNGLVSPLAGLFKALDRDGDGKVYPRELEEFIAGQAVAARGHLTMTASDEGRALFGMLDLDRDRRLGAREVLGTFAQVSACDRDRDGRVTRSNSIRSWCQSRPSQPSRTRGRSSAPNARALRFPVP